MPARVVLGVGAGISAYKACELLRLLTEAGHQVRVVPTQDALRFVGEATWAGLSGEPVLTDVWTGISEAPHVKLGKEADLIAVVPATADLMARAAAGMANDLLTATLLMATCRWCSRPRCIPRCGSTRRRRPTSRRSASAVPS